MKRLALPIAAALALSACATAPTTYTPAAGPRAVGYSDYQIEPARYRITFRGGPGGPPEQVADLALLRAADLALAAGYDWFRVVDRWTDRTGAGSGPRFSVGAGGGDYGRGSSVGVGVGTSFNLGGGPAFIQSIEVVMGRGPAPQDSAVYDAREIRRAIGGRL